MVYGLSFAAIFAVAGCGGSPDDPLSGTWRNETCFGSSVTPPDIEKCTVALTFTNDLEIEVMAEWVSLPATADHPGCTTTKLVTGQTWSTRHATDVEILNVKGSGTATVERYDCVKDEDNMDTRATSDIEIPPGDMSYQISDDKLTILSGTLAGTYTR
jgi:hypothetical protein